MSSNAQTALIPRQRDVPREGSSPAGDAWDRQGEGDHEEQSLAARRQALSTLAWVLPSLVAALLGIVRATWPGQRAEELDFWGFAVRPWSEALALLDGMDTTTALYYAGLKGWAEAFGTTDFSLRLPSVLAMAAATALCAKVGTGLATPRVGLIGGLLFALLPTTSRYAQEIGPQALVICLAALSTVALVRVLDRPKVLRVIGYVLTVMLLGVASAPALSLVVAHGVAILTMRRRVFFGWFAGVLVALLPAAAVAYALKSPLLDVGEASAVPLSELTRLPAVLFGVPLLGGIVIGLGLLSISMRKPGVVFTTWAIGPGVVLYLVALVTPVWSLETLLLTLPAWTLLSAMALNRAPVFRGLLVAFAATLLVLPDQADIRRRDGHGVGAADVAAVLAENVKQGDVVVYGPTERDGQVGRDLMARYVRADLQPKDVLAKRAPRTDGNLFAEECPDVAACLNGAARVWLLRASSTSAPLEGMPATKDGPLRTGYVIERTWHPTGLTLTLFTLAPATAQR
jgi:mannosyltransferase